ncbi:SIR2 family protein [Candidatus Dependentiae bacterium]|nr:SIR2 family protein [Candidatus Dependentiae bacterium]
MGKKEESDIQKIKLRIKNYLELDNVSLLIGAGASFHLGAPIIRKIPQQIIDDINKDKKLNKFYDEKFKAINNSEISLEEFLNFLIAERYLLQTQKKDTENHIKLISAIQTSLFKLCNTQNIELNKDYQEDNNLKENRYFYHEKLIKKILQRPINLKRINLFTTNYDLAFDYAFDNLGIHCINGFSGFQRRCFRPETYDYDIYYPGDTTSGKVHRAEKVIRYFKIHGSLSWVNKTPTSDNWYGIEEIIIDKEKPDNELVIYPCATKKSFALDFPYSELFRLFSHNIKQSQTVLFCLGYSFYDEHINDIIFQALSIPSFTLFVIDFQQNENIKKLIELDDPRIIIITGEKAKFTNFVSEILPDLYEEKDTLKVIDTINKLKENASNEIKNNEPKDNGVVF